MLHNLVAFGKGFFLKGLRKAKCPHLPLSLNFVKQGFSGRCKTKFGNYRGVRSSSLPDPCADRNLNTRSFSTVGLLKKYSQPGKPSGKLVHKGDN